MSLKAHDSIARLESSTAESVASVPSLESSRHHARFSWPRFHFSERKLLLAVLDLLILNSAFVITLLVRFKLDHESYSLSYHLTWFIVLNSLWLAASFTCDAYDLVRAAKAMDSFWAVSGATLVCIGIFLCLPRITPTLPTRRIEILMFPVLTILGLSAWRVCYATVFTQPHFQRRILIVGAGWAGQTLLEAIGNNGHSDGEASFGGKTNGAGEMIYSVLGFIDDNPAKQGQRIAGIPVLGGCAHLFPSVLSLQPDELVIAITHQHTISPELFQAILNCSEASIQVTTMTSFFEHLTGRVPVEHAGRDLNTVIPVSHHPFHRLYLAGAHTVEIVAALIGCGLTALVSPVIWVGNRLTSPGDLFYRQKRVGQAGKVFEIVKFRSMIMDAEKHTGSIWAQPNDHRVTGIGRILRKTRLDELPQCWNILKGEMSLIGPRPERPEFVQKLTEEIPFYRVRHAIRPGITGWAQIKYRYGASVQDSLMKLQYDLYYLKYQGLHLDLQILLRTAAIVLGLKGR